MAALKPIYRKVIDELQNEVENLKTTNKVLAFELDYYKNIPYFKLDNTKREQVDKLIFDLITKQV